MLFHMHSIVRAKGPDSNFPQVPIKPTAKQMKWSEVCAVHWWEVVINLISFGVNLTDLSKTEKQNLFFLVRCWLHSGVGFKGGRTSEPGAPGFRSNTGPGFSFTAWASAGPWFSVQSHFDPCRNHYGRPVPAGTLHSKLGEFHSGGVRWVCHSSPGSLPLDVSSIPSLK